MASDQSLLRGGLLVTLLGGSLSIGAVLLQYWLRSDNPESARTPISAQVGDRASDAAVGTASPPSTAAASQEGEDRPQDAASKEAERDLPRREEVAPAKLSDQQLQENCLNRRRLASIRGAKPLVVVAVRPGGTDSEATADPPSDLIRGGLAQGIIEQQRAAATDAFKPWFYSSGLFDQVWAGDSEILARLGLLDEARQSILLARAELAPAKQSDFAGIVYVEGTLALRLLTNRGAKGPVTVSMSGSGGSAARAALNCARRLVDSVDLTTLFAEEP